MLRKKICLYTAVRNINIDTDLKTVSVVFRWASYDSYDDNSANKFISRYRTIVLVVVAKIIQH